MWKTRSILNILKIKPGEEKLVLLLIGYSFFMGGATAVFYTVVVSSFLINFDSGVLPQAYIAGGILVYAIGLLITRLQQRISSEKLGEGMLISLILSIVALLAIYHITGSRWVFFALFIWNRFFVLVNGVTFWAVVAKLFNFQQSKRLSSLINTGEVVASVIAYLSMPLIIKFVNTDFLLIFVVLLLVACGLLIHRIHTHYITNSADPQVQIIPEKQALDRKSTEKIDKSYYQIIFSLALIPVFGLFYVEYIFLKESRIIFPNKQSLTSFLAIFFGVCSIVEFFIKTFLYNRLVSKYGMRTGIIILPVSLAFSFALAVSYGLAYDTAAIFFACIVLARFFMSAVRKAISEPVYQILYQPISPGKRLEIQGRIEGRAKSVGGLVAGIVLLALHQFSAIGDLALSVIFLVICLCWVLISIKGQGAYKRIVRDKTFEKPAMAAYKTFVPDFASHYPDFETLTHLAISPNEADRLHAAYGLCRSNRFLAYKFLIPLLQDNHPKVREAAIFASGELGTAELWPYLFEQLDEDRYYHMASNALIKTGLPLLKHIEKFFLSGSESKLHQIKLLRIVQGIGGPEAIKFLRKKILNPNRFIKEQVVRSLRNLGYTCTTTEQNHFLQELDDYLSIYAWVLAAQEDLLDTYPQESQLLIVLDREKEQIIGKVFIILEVIYGSKFNVFSLLKGEQEEEVRDYLIEISDLLLPEDVKNKLLPFLESTSPYEMLGRYREIYPQHKLTVEERLKDIVNKDYTRISRWTKAVAIKELKNYEAESVTPVLVANAISSSKVVSETAFYILRIVNPKRFASLFKIIVSQNDTFHKKIMEPLDWLSSEEDLLICKLRRLRAMDQLSHLSNENLQRILLHSTYFKEDEGDVKDLRKFTDGKEVSLILVYGELQFSKSEKVSSNEIWNITEKKKEGIVMIPHMLADSEFYILETYILRDLSIESMTQEAVQV